MSTTVTSWPTAFLSDKRLVGDPLADHVIQTLLDTNQKGEIDQIFQMLVRNRQFPNPAFDALPDAVKEVVEGYFVKTFQLPAFAEPFKLMIAADIFRQHGPKILFILLCKSLPLCYTCWRGAKVLYQTGRLRVQDGSLNAFSRRMMETAQFVVDVLTKDNFEQDGTAIVATQKVRLMHAIIRHFALERKWDVPNYGIPINQEDLVGTLLSFSVVIMKGLEQLGVVLTPEEEEAYLHLWHVVGTMMGIDADLLSENKETCEALMDAILEHQSGPSQEGTELTRACIELMNDRMVFGPLKRLSPYFIRFFIDDKYADMLQVESPDVSDSFLIESVQWFDKHIRGLDNRHLIMAALGRTLSHGMINRFLTYTNAARQDQFYLPSSLTDEWDSIQPDFRIPHVEHIDDVISQLDRLSRLFRAQNNPIGLFTAVYRAVTQRVADGIKENIFENPTDMERLDVGFANRYFDALNCYFDGKPATAPWQLSFDACRKPLITNQHIFAAANAHITFDLPIVLTEVFQHKDLATIKPDFDRMNVLFDDMYDQMNDNVGRIFRPFGWLLRFIDTKFKAMERSIMATNRAKSWQDCLALQAANSLTDRHAIINQIESRSTAAGLAIIDLPLLLRLILSLIAKKEFGTPAQKIDVMLRSSLLPQVRNPRKSDQQ